MPRSHISQVVTQVMVSFGRPWVHLSVLYARSFLWNDGSGLLQQEHVKRGRVVLYRYMDDVLVVVPRDTDLENKLRKLNSVNSKWRKRRITSNLFSTL